MRTLKITSGPDRLRLAHCLLEGDNKTQLTASFVVQENAPSGEWSEHIKLNSVEREDGSGQNFNLVGYNTANRAKVKIFYSLRNRQGTMTFE